MLQLALDNLLSPMILFYALGVAAAISRSDLEFPEPVAKALALYLMAATGFKGGAQLAENGVDLQVALSLAVAVGLSFLLPVVAFSLLRAFSRAKPVDAAAIAAHYGSISIVTFVTCAAMLSELAISYEAQMVAMAALMETPAIVSGLLLARSGTRNAGEALFAPAVLRKVLLSGSILLLLGSFVIGWVSGAKGMEAVHPFFVAPFKGALCLFLLDLGLIAGARLRDFRGMGYGLAAFGIYMPVIGSGVGLAAAWVLGLSLGGATLLAVLCASASYIVVPAAMRLALPQANPAYSVTLALSITFPFNIVIGIPLYLAVARWLLGETTP